MDSKERPVIDGVGGRFGFLEKDGSVNWLGGNVGDIGSLAAAIVQRPTEVLANEIDGLDPVDVE